MRRLATLLAALLLVFGWVGPSSAVAQGAGDDQYQDPFGDETSQSDGSGSDSEGGLSDEPPVSGGGSSSGLGSGGGSSSGSSGGGSGTAPSTGSGAPAATTEASGQLPHTGAEAFLIMGLGVAFVLTGVGLRLRTIDPDAF